MSEVIKRHVLQGKKKARIFNIFMIVFVVGESTARVFFWHVREERINIF